MRTDERRLDQLREMNFEIDYLEYPAGSCLITVGRTRVLCAVSVENRVPQFLFGKGTGWLTAEYSLLPFATQDRTMREAHAGRLSGRTQEIRRFIGRSLRPIFDLRSVGEKTFIIDCDVIQADGGTRTAAVNGAFVALHSAVDKMMLNKQFIKSPILDYVAAVSLGIVKGEAMLDLDYDEDSSAEIDMNLVMTGRGKIIEAQATAERLPVTREKFNELMDLGVSGIQKIIGLEKKVLESRKR
ncbi:ribonuclease PH [candidate division WOR_3 bacterium SM23_42]|uniref:Ribonuclease PH n=1 Tax=candidate division WOR_3 bacterium SM23_42 TaxID=1703779 RepID=A0A0S8FSK8_UNCW3|nr:MAG: ribonuclease PH [candidate division WOR_3 bacterium SM23_42]